MKFMKVDLRNAFSFDISLLNFFQTPNSRFIARFHTDFENPCPKHAMVCQRTTQGNTKDCGGSPFRFADGENGANLGVTVEVTDGDDGCDDLKRTTTIHVNCGTDTEPVITEDENCHYTIRYSNMLACPKPGVPVWTKPMSG